MARLPDLKTQGLYIEWPERDEWATKTKGFFSFIGQAVRNGVAKEKIKIKEERSEKERN